ncbi:MAG: hypothetical protein AB2777_21205 [Candidatus Thiodiazotropha endolucinida]
MASSEVTAISLDIVMFDLALELVGIHVLAEAHTILPQNFRFDRILVLLKQ